jgi:hypothetical protein
MSSAAIEFCLTRPKCSQLFVKVKEMREHMQNNGGKIKSCSNNRAFCPDFLTSQYYSWDIEQKIWLICFTCNVMMMNHLRDWNGKRERRLNVWQIQHPNQKVYLEVYFVLLYYSLIKSVFVKSCRFQIWCDKWNLPEKKRKNTLVMIVFGKMIF